MRKVLLITLILFFIGLVSTFVLLLIQGVSLKEFSLSTGNFFEIIIGEKMFGNDNSCNWPPYDIRKIGSFILFSFVIIIQWSVLLYISRMAYWFSYFVIRDGRFFSKIGYDEVEDIERKEEPYNVLLIITNLRSIFFSYIILSWVFALYQFIYQGFAGKGFPINELLIVIVPFGGNIEYIENYWINLPNWIISNNISILNSLCII